MLLTIILKYVGFFLSVYGGSTSLFWDTFSSTCLGTWLAGRCLGTWLVNWSSLRTYSSIWPSWCSGLTSRCLSMCQGTCSSKWHMLFWWPSRHPFQWPSRSSKPFFACCSNDLAAAYYRMAQTILKKTKHKCLSTCPITCLASTWLGTCLADTCLGPAGVFLGEVQNWFILTKKLVSVPKWNIHKYFN